MSYCRFENTKPDLRDCVDSWCDELSDTEARSRLAIFEMMLEVIDQEGIEINEEDVENAISRLRA